MIEEGGHGFAETKSLNTTIDVYFTGQESTSSFLPPTSKDFCLPPNIKIKPRLCSTLAHYSGETILSRIYQLQARKQMLDVAIHKKPN
ncbi:MAG: hypothetical protein EHM14_03800 [Methanothrix sp.]|nr:MAG: hypothetical protein EHM14_03800 [Methanothrix sp.]